MISIIFVYINTSAQFEIIRLKKKLTSHIEREFNLQTYEESIRVWGEERFPLMVSDPLGGGGWL